MSRALRPSAKVLPVDARAHNRALVLQQLFSASPMSRAEVSRATGLTAATTSHIVAELVASGYVRERVDRPQGGVGRPGTLLEVDTETHQIVVLDLADAGLGVRGARSTLTGELSGIRQLEPGAEDEEGFLARLAVFCRELIADAPGHVIGSGVSSPGMIDVTGRVLQASNRGWHDFPLAARLQALIGLPVHVANDAYTLMLGEYTFGDANEQGSILVTIGIGVGSGVLVDGLIVRGAEHAPGEIGHVRVVNDEPLPCKCGRYGCLETVVSVPALERDTAGRTAAQASVVITSAGRALGQTLAPIVSALNLVDIILSGPSEVLTEDLRAGVLEIIRERTLPTQSDHVAVRTASLAENVVLAGAAVLVLSAELGIS